MASRRSFLQTAVSAGLWLGAAVRKPGMLIAAGSNTAVAQSPSDSALAALVGNQAVTESNQITLVAPNLAEDGSVVPITVSSRLTDVESIAVLVEKNPVPLIAHIELGAHTEPFLSARLKMAETDDIIVLIKAGGRYYARRKRVAVTVGGCGT